MRGEEYYKQLVSGARGGFGDRLLLGLLKLAALLYSSGMRVRSAFYTTGIFPTRVLPVPVISVGNITMGGTGKTPTVLLLARELFARGKRPAVLTRGYGSSREGETLIVSDGDSVFLDPAEAGDEPCLLASSLPGLMVVMGSDRYAAGRLALEKLSPDCFILDDGFQHQRLHRDLDILLLDATTPFANGWTCPAGFLREPPSAARRADLVLLTRSSASMGIPHGMPSGVPISRSSHALKGVVPLAGGDIRSFSDLSGRRVVAFSGIADPAAFFDGIEAEGVSLVSTLAFPDHTEYGTRQMEALGTLKRQSKGDCLITTAKDAVKLKPYLKVIGECYIVQMELALHDPEPLNAALDNLFKTEVSHGAVT